MSRPSAQAPQRSPDAVRAARRWAPAPRDQRTGSRLGGPIAFSAVVHAVVIAAAFVWRPAPPPPLPPVYRVDLVAAPPGPRAQGIVAPQPAPQGTAATPAPAPPTPAPPAPTPPAPVPPRPAAPTPPRAAESVPKEMPLPARPTDPARRPPPARATPNPAPARPTPPAPAPSTRTPPAPAPSTARPTPARTGERTGTPGAAGPVGPRAGGGPEGGRGTDVANVSIRGLDFPYPGYLANIVRQVALRFEPPNRNAPLQADVSFLIHRDGSVTDIRVVRGSRNYAFDLEARGAIEAAGAAKAFGALPEAFRDDVLPVTFSFDPRVIR